MSIFGKLKDFVGIPTSDDFDGYDDIVDVRDDDYGDMYEPSMEQPPLDTKGQFRTEAEPDLHSKASAGMSNVVGMHGNRFWGAGAEVLVMEPRAFEEMPQVIQALRERKSVVLNLSLMEPAQAQRAVDFVAGATYTIDGHQERVGENIFLFTPSCVQVRTQTGVIHESPQVATPSSRMSVTSWQTDPVMSHMAQ